MLKLTPFALAIALVGTSPALADVPGREWISSAQVSQALAKMGYQVRQIEADDGHWEGEATKGGRNYDFHVDSRTGRVTKMELDND